jgi:hypothetical protein
MERMVVLVTPEQKAAITSRAKAEKLTMGELVRRSVERYTPSEDEGLLEKLIDQVNESTRRAEAALDDALARIEASMKRIDRLEKRAAAGARRKR